MLIADDLGPGRWERPWQVALGLATAVILLGGLLPPVAGAAAPELPSHSRRTAAAGSSWRTSWARDR
jgi:hypothetical protein